MKKRQANSLTLLNLISGQTLSDLRHELEELANGGLRDHTAQAMWQHVLYQEVLLAVRERVLPAAQRNYDLLKQVADIESNLNLDKETVSVDFTDRFENSVSKLIDAIKDRKNKDESVREFTATFFDKIIPKTRDSILSLNKFYSKIVIMIDDLDKGWPPQSLDKQDVVIVRHLIEALRKIERELRSRGQSFNSMVFLRSDVYENLVDVTSDRNKQNVVRIDWSDTAQLAYLMKQRVVSAFADVSTKEEAWEAFNPILSDGRHAIDHLVNASLYRPRFLIDLSQRVLARTVNRGAVYVSDDDVELALDEMSLYLISDFGFEVRDVSGIREDLFYLFIGCKDIITKDEILNILDNEISGIDIDKMIQLLMWYGFLGVAKSDQRKIYIFDRGYDLRRLLADRDAKIEDTMYCVNPAFLRGLAD